MGIKGLLARLGPSHRGLGTGLCSGNSLHKAPFSGEGQCVCFWRGGGGTGGWGGGEGVQEKELYCQNLQVSFFSRRLKEAEKVPSL